MAEQFIESTLMDGYAGGPHITETQTGLANQGLYGEDDYVLSAGRKAEAQVLTNNSIRIFDAVFVIQGRRDVIAANDYSDVSIDNGAQGMNRNDIIVRRYTKDESSEIETTEYAVIKGTPASGEAEDPEVTTGDLRSGAMLHEMKLYRVKLEGLNIVAVEPLFQVLPTLSQLEIPDIVITEEVIGPYTINNQNAITQELQITPPDGYELALPIVGQTGSRYVYAYSCVVNTSVNNGYIIQLANFSGYSASASPKMYYICKKLSS